MFRTSIRRVIRPALNTRVTYGPQQLYSVGSKQSHRFSTTPTSHSDSPIPSGSSNSPGSSNSESMITPWYVAEALKSSGPTVPTASVDLPPMPAKSPEALPKVVEFAIKDMGLKDVVIIDKRTEDDDGISSALGPALMVVGTGTSTKHLGSAAAIFMTWLKKEFGIHADREGVLTTNFVKLHNRRQRRRQQRHRASREDSHLQRVGSWIAVDTKLDSIYLHVMTAERRAEIDLENLGDWVEDNEIDDADLVKLEKGYANPISNASTSKKILGRMSYSTHVSEQSSEAPPYPSSREELALQNLASSKYDDLSEDHPVVKSFVEHFPKTPTQEDWKRRLNFFALATVQSPIFSPRRLLDEAELQQASGFVLDNQDIEMVVSAICYHGQSHFATLSRDDESLAAWSEISNMKADLLVRLYDVIMRPQGRPLLTNTRLLTLLYRTFTGMCASSTTPTNALENIDNAELKFEKPTEVFMDSSRTTPLRYLLETTGEMRNIQTVGMILTSLCTENAFDAFWKICNAAVLSDTSLDFSESVIELAVSLVVRSGNETQIQYAIQSYLPNSIMSGNIRLTPAMIKAMNAGLEIVDSEKNSKFDSVRRIISQYEEPTAQLT